jgi:hypothetical protein
MVCVSVVIKMAVIVVGSEWQGWSWGVDYGAYFSHMKQVSSLRRETASPWDDIVENGQYSRECEEQ